MQFVVGTDGKIEVETARVTNTENEQIANAIIQTLPDWVFQPARIGDEPVRQIVMIEQSASPNRIPFTVSRGSGPGIPPARRDPDPRTGC